MTDTEAETSKAAKAAKASAAKATKAQAAIDKAAAEAGAELDSLGDGAAVTVEASAYVPGYHAELTRPQIQLAKKLNAVSIQPTGEPQTVYVAGLVRNKWCHLAKCGVPANSPGVVKVPAGTLAFSKPGGGDIVVVACRV